MSQCVHELRQTARTADGLRVVDDARVVEDDRGRAIEATLRGRERVPHALSDAMLCYGLRLDLRRSGVRDGGATAVYR